MLHLIFAGADRQEATGHPNAKGKDKSKKSNKKRKGKKGKKKDKDKDKDKKTKGAGVPQDDRCAGNGGSVVTGLMALMAQARATQSGPEEAMRSRGGRRSDGRPRQATVSSDAMTSVCEGGVVPPTFRVTSILSSHNIKQSPTSSSVGSESSSLPVRCAVVPRGVLGVMAEAEIHTLLFIR